MIKNVPELLELFAEHHKFVFQQVSNTHDSRIVFCDHLSCVDCKIRTLCDEFTDSLPKLTASEIDLFIKNHPEYFI